MGDTADTIGAITNAGKAAWDIVNDGRASSGARSSFCSAVPKKLKFSELYGWKTKSGTWKRHWTNAYGWKVIEYELAYSFQYAGTSDKAPGAMFVNNFSIWAKSTSVDWFFRLDIDATVKGNPINVGSAKKVIGAVPLLVTASVNGLNAKSETMLLTAQGDGKLKVT